jgi:hypothetical protein
MAKRTGHRRRRRRAKMQALRQRQRPIQSAMTERSTPYEREILQVMRSDRHDRTRQTKQHMHYNPVWAVRLFRTSSANPLFKDSKHKGCIARHHVGRSRAKSGGTVFESWTFHDRRKKAKVRVKPKVVEVQGNTLVVIRKRKGLTL